MSRRSTTAALLAAGLTLSACGGSDAAETTDESTGETTEETTATTAAESSSEQSETTEAPETTVTTVTEELDVFALAVGDCLADFPSGSVESVLAQSCDDEHLLEVYYAFDLEDTGAYPGDTEVDALADQGCYDAFEPFVGNAYETSIYGYTYLTPTADGWEQLGDHEVLCLLGDVDSNLLTGTAEGSGL